MLSRLVRNGWLATSMIGVVACAGDGTGLDENGDPIAQGAIVTISTARLSLPVGGSTMVTASVQDADGNEVPGAPVTWASSNTSVVTVDIDGLATGVGAGSAVVTATAQSVSGQVSVAIVQSAGLSTDVQPIFDGNCAFSGCHAGTQPQQGLNLTAGRSHDNTVGVSSNELPSMARVFPDDPETSYLVHKVQGTHIDVGGTGSQMPLGGGTLTQSQIDIIRAWVQTGAENN